MSNISDIIEEFLMQTMGESMSMDISRNELANYFGVAPSQINYVLTTRFNYERGYIIESRRGGGGFITISKTKGNSDEWLSEVMNNTLKSDIDSRVATYLIDELCERGIFSNDEANILRSVVHVQALNNPFRIEGKLRAQVIRKALIDKLERKGE